MWVANATLKGNIELQTQIKYSNCGQICNRYFWLTTAYTNFVINLLIADVAQFVFDTPYSYVITYIVYKYYLSTLRLFRSHWDDRLKRALSYHGHILSNYFIGDCTVGNAFRVIVMPGSPSQLPKYKTKHKLNFFQHQRDG